jgi:hypothetical protein
MVHAVVGRVPRLPARAEGPMEARRHGGWRDWQKAERRADGNGYNDDDWGKHGDKDEGGRRWLQRTRMAATDADWTNHARTFYQSWTMAMAATNTASMVATDGDGCNEDLGPQPQTSSNGRTSPATGSLATPPELVVCAQPPETSPEPLPPCCHWHGEGNFVGSLSADGPAAPGIDNWSQHLDSTFGYNLKDQSIGMSVYDALSPHWHQLHLNACLTKANRAYTLECNVCGRCVHGRYGYWVADRGLQAFTDLLAFIRRDGPSALPAPPPPPPPPPLCTSQDARRTVPPPPPPPCTSRRQQ